MPRGFSAGWQLTNINIPTPKKIGAAHGNVRIRASSAFEFERSNMRNCVE